MLHKSHTFINFRKIITEISDFATEVAMKSFSPTKLVEKCITEAARLGIWGSTIFLFLISVKFLLFIKLASWCIDL